MYMPTLFDGSLFDDWFDEPFRAMDRAADRRLYGRDVSRIMKTDVREMSDHYEVAIDLPGFKKEEVSAKLDNGYLTISASKSHSNDEKDKESGKYIRRERYAGSVSRSYYVGSNVKKEDIRGKFEDGILTLSIPKKDAPTVEDSKFINIE